MMISANPALPGSYDYGEVARSMIIAIAASYAALDLVGRVTAARGRARLAWLSGGAIAMGIGIWAIAPLGDVDLPFACARRVRLADSSGSAHCGNRRVCGGTVCGQPPENGSRRGLDRQRIYGRGPRRPALPR